LTRLKIGEYDVPRYRARGARGQDQLESAVARRQRPKLTGGFSQVRATQAYSQEYVEKTEREKPR
jgi:hypothetical protein